uniref:Uncharacterized protein n=1 Tax=Hordeum vulgare subsp. vulgare TaxID=112509 RepID=A0A8I6Y889_HORVV
MHVHASGYFNSCTSGSKFPVCPHALLDLLVLLRLLFIACFPLQLRHDRRMAYPAQAISAGDELRIEKARILSMIDQPNCLNRNY